MVFPIFLSATFNDRSHPISFFFKQTLLIMFLTYGVLICLRFCYHQLQTDIKPFKPYSTLLVTSYCALRRKDAWFCISRKGGTGGGGWGRPQGDMHMVAAKLSKCHGWDRASQFLPWLHGQAQKTLLSPCRGFISGRKGYLGSEQMRTIWFLAYGINIIHVLGWQALCQQKGLERMKWGSFPKRDIAVPVLGCRNPLVGTKVEETLKQVGYVTSVNSLMAV